MKAKFVLAVAMLAALPFCAQAQQPKAATNADAQRVVNMISSDKEKTKAYCDINALGDEMDKAQQTQNNKRIEELAQQANVLADKLGKEWADLMEGLQGVDEKSKEGQAISVTLEGLDKLCAK